MQLIARRWRDQSMKGLQWEGENLQKISKPMQIEPAKVWHGVERSDKEWQGDKLTMSDKV